MLNVPCVQTTYVQLMDVASHVHAYGTYRNRILLIETVIPYSIVKFNNVSHVKEYLLSFCQSNIDSQALGSNTCTIIAVLTSPPILHGFLNTTSSLHWIPLSLLTATNYLLKETRCMHDNLDESQINYCAPEIIEHPELGLAGVAERGEEYQFDNFVDLLELQMLSLARVKLAFVLIFSPDKSMTLFLNELGESMLIDSHSHLDTGAIIATASDNQLHYMVNYIQEMILRDWGPTVQPPFDVTIVKLK